MEHATTRRIVRVILLLLAGCAGDLQNPDRFQPGTEIGPDAAPDAAGEGDCPEDVQASILVPGCTSSVCHDDDDPAGGLDLLADGLEERLLGSVSESSECGGEILVDPEDPERSLLLEKLQQAPSCGDSMPLLADPLPAEQRECLAQWVRAMVEGAP